MSLNDANKVLICGAGPTGLVLALWLTKNGVPVRIIDKADRSGTTSRAIVVHARTLEFYRQLGIDQQVVAAGTEFRSANFWVHKKRIRKILFGESGSTISAFPYMLIFPQDAHEALLEAELNKCGVVVDRGCEMTRYEQTDSGVKAWITTPSGEDVFEARFLAGCDGAHSIVRKSMQVSFSGGTYDNVFYVADLEGSGAVANGEMHGVLDSADFLAIFPMKGQGNVRLVGTVLPEDMKKEKLTWEDVAQDIIRNSGLEVKKVRWFSTYKVHHRVASSFRDKNVFLLGDAGHVHSPVGGQGMNTGIGDAVNLAWKVAAVIKGTSPESILETYEPERIAFARKLVATTDRAFRFVDRRSFIATQIRTRIAPVAVAIMFSFRNFRKFVFKYLSQTQISYRNSLLSSGSTAGLKGGDRLPWVSFNSNDNYECLKKMDWQLHVYGAAPPDASFTESLKIEVYKFEWTDEVQQKGFSRDYWYLIRPDGHIGIIASQNDPQKIRKYYNRWIVGRIS